MKSDFLDFPNLPLDTRIDILALMADYDWVSAEHWVRDNGDYWNVYVGTWISGDDAKPVKTYRFYKGDFDKKAIDVACLLKYGTTNL